MFSVPNRSHWLPAPPALRSLPSTVDYIQINVLEPS